MILRAICTRSPSSAALISFAHSTARRWSQFSSREPTWPSPWSVFLNRNEYFHCLFRRFAGVPARELMVSPAFLMVQKSIKDVKAVKREMTGTNGPENHESLSYLHLTRNSNHQNPHENHTRPNQPQQAKVLPQPAPADKSSKDDAYLANSPGIAHMSNRIRL